MSADVLTIVGWLWRAADGRSIYTPNHVKTWAKMIDRHLKMPHRFIVVTDQPEADFGPLVTAVPLWDDWRKLRNANWGDKKPQCYPRLKCFDPEIGKILGQRFASIDLDVVVLAALDPVLDRPEDFLIIRRTPLNKREQEDTYQGSMWLMTAGARPQVWNEFRGEVSIAAASHFMGSDQAWIRHMLGPNEKGWTEADGVYCFRNLQRDPRFQTNAPKNARLVAFNTSQKPWEFELRAKIAGVRCHQCGALQRTARWSKNTGDFDWVVKNYA